MLTTHCLEMQEQDLEQMLAMEKIARLYSWLKDKCLLCCHLQQKWFMVSVGTFKVLFGLSKGSEIQVSDGKVPEEAVCTYMYLPVCLLSNIPLFLYWMVSVTCKQVIAPVVLLLWNSLHALWHIIL